MTAPLSGRNLVRLLYLDEAGTTRSATFVAVSGVMVHGDHEWPEVTKRIDALIERHVPALDRPGFIFHATDIFHGSGYFDRRKPEWATPDQRWPILVDLAAIIEELHLPIMLGGYQKDEFGIGMVELQQETSSEKDAFIQNVSVVDCLLRADQWLDRYAPSELATVVHEDGTSAKPMIKRTLKGLRSTMTMDAFGVSQALREKFKLPLRRIIDTVHFADKVDAKPLQLADLCAFTFARFFQHKTIPKGVWDILFRHIQWFLARDVIGAVNAAFLPADVSEPPA